MQGVPKKGVTCVNFFRDNATALAAVPLIVGIQSATAMDELAFFLTVRGPYAWLGYGWKGCGELPPLPALLKREYGKPMANFTFNGTVARREWSPSSPSALETPCM